MKTISEHLSPYRAFLSGEKQRVAALIRAERDGYKAAVESSAAELEQRYA